MTKCSLIPIQNYAPGLIIEATDKEYASVKMKSTVLRRMQEALDALQSAPAHPLPLPTALAEEYRPTVLAGSGPQQGFNP